MLPRKVNRQESVSLSERSCYMSLANHRWFWWNYQYLMQALTDVMNSYINVHTMTNLSTDNYQKWASGEHKRKHYRHKKHASVQTRMLPSPYMPQQSCNDLSSIFINYAMLWIINMVSQTDNCKLYLLSYEIIRRAGVFFVKNLLQKSCRICCVTRQESIHDIAQFPTPVIEADTKLPPFYRRHFLIFFLEWKGMKFA